MCPPRDPEAESLSCTTAPGCTHFSIATSERWSKVREGGVGGTMRYYGVYSLPDTHTHAHMLENMCSSFMYDFVHRQVKLTFVDCFTGLYPEIPDGSQLDFSALKEEVK